MRGVNSRLDEIQAAMLNVKLRYLNMETKHRRKIAAAYRAGIDNSQIILPGENSADSTLDDISHVWHLFVVRCAHREVLQKHLTENGIQSQIHYPTPPHQQKAYNDWSTHSYPVTETIHQQVISLPMGPTMTFDQVNTVITACNLFK